MTIRGGGNPNSAMAAMPLGEWTRRLGALPAEAYDCFMVETPCGFNRIQAWFARLLAANGRLPSDHRAATARDGGGNVRSGWKNARGAGRTKEWSNNARQKWRDAPLTKKAPYKPYAGKPHVRICAGGREVTRVPTARLRFAAVHESPTRHCSHAAFLPTGAKSTHFASIGCENFPNC